MKTSTMGMGTSSSNKKIEKDESTYCIICCENDIQSQRLVCGHSFCYDCILAIDHYEDSPRCPLCRETISIEGSISLDKRSRFPKISKMANVSAIVVSCFLFCYNIFPIIRRCLHALFLLTVAAFDVLLKTVTQRRKPVLHDFTPNWTWTEMCGLETSFERMESVL